MVMPSEASSWYGMLSRNVVRYHEVPGWAVAAGTLAVDQVWSGKPGRDQPARSPNRPPLLTGPRTGSARSSPLWSPWIRQLIAGVTGAADAPVKAAEMRAR